MGILDCKGGSIKLEGKEITKLPPSLRTKAGLGYVPQGREIFPRLTIDENLKVGLQARTDGLKKVPENKIFSLFPDLQQMGNRMGGNLSGGQQQQLAISRALIGAPSVLILDEPTEGIQPSIIQSIEKVLVDLKKQGDLTIILVEQYFDFAWEIADYFYLMDRGSISLSGAKSDLTESEVKKYLTF